VSAPILWIFFPIALGALLLLFRNQRLLALVAGFACAFLAITALLLPVDTPLTIQALTFKLTASFDILGRRLTLVNSDRAWLAMLYGASAFWFMASASIKVARRLIPIGLVISGLLVAALAVEPFLYAALLIETAVLLSIPLLSPPNRKPGKGILRFLIYQTIAMPFILFSGWLLTGIEANPGDLMLVGRSATLLGLGFALLLAVFPFYTWIPLLSEEAHPYIAGFILWSFPTVTMFFGLGFLERYAWLRDAAALPSILVTVGVVMVFSGGLFAVFQRHLGRMMGYAVMVETGFSLVGLGLGGSFGLDTFLLLCIPRLIGLSLWSLALSNLLEHNPSLKMDDLKGAGRIWSFSTAGVVLASLSLAGLPLLASFPPHQAIWETLARQSVPAVAWVFAGSLGLTIGAIRVMISLANASENSPWGMRETWSQRFFILLGCVMLFLLGIIPSWMAALWSKLPALFEHLGQ
jgi:formate hydrogenlyase subunit 3/multisubunit Na+/H+ antiporter MnhD subunit